MLSDTLFNYAPVKSIGKLKGSIDNYLGSANAAKKYILGTEEKTSPKRTGYDNKYDEQEYILDWVNRNSWLSSIDTETKDIENNKVEGNGHSIIRIQPNYALYSRSRGDLIPIVGVMQFDLELTVKAEWEALGFPFPFLENVVNSVSKASMWGNSGSIGEVYRSKKIWKKSGYLEISPKFRVIDWNGDGLPIRAAIMAQRYALPYPRPNELSDEAKAVENSIKKNGLTGGLETILGRMKDSSSEVKTVIDIASDAVEKGKEIGKDIISSIGDLDMLKNKAQTAANSNLGKDISDTARDIYLNATEDLHDLFTLYDSPPPVKLQIGQFFYHPDMIIESVNVQFSDEKTECGPVYVDITLTMSSRKIMQGYADTGLVEYANRSRINREFQSDINPQNQATINETKANKSNTQI